MKLAAVTRFGFLLATIAISGCSTEQWRHVQQNTWMWKIQDGKGSQRPLFSEGDYYELMAQDLLDEYESIRVGAVNTLTVDTVAIGYRYTFLPDAYIDQGRDEMLYDYLKTAYAQTSDESYHRLRVLSALVQLHMRRYLWKHPEFGHNLEPKIDRKAPPRVGFDDFDYIHYPAFAERLVADGNEEFARHWAEFQRLWRVHFGKTHPGLRRAAEREGRASSRPHASE